MPIHIVQGKKMEYRKNSRGWDTRLPTLRTLSTANMITKEVQATSQWPSLFNVKSRLQIDEHGLLDRAHGDL